VLLTVVLPDPRYRFTAVWLDASDVKRINRELVAWLSETLDLQRLLVLAEFVEYRHGRLALPCPQMGCST
jgi:hypothetical protein